MFGLQPQVASAFFLRQDGKMQTWKPNSEVQAGFAELPKRFSSLSVIDMRASYDLHIIATQFLAAFGEMGLEGIGMLGSNGTFPIRPERLAPTEMITTPLFPNITVSNN